MANACRNRLRGFASSVIDISVKIPSRPSARPNMHRKHELPGRALVTTRSSWLQKNGPILEKGYKERWPSLCAFQTN